MKTNLLTLLTVFLLSLTSFSAGNKENVIYFKNEISVSRDSSEDNPNTLQMTGDLSGMFNERGYYSSNSINYDENEIISDFNGNLMYSIPMYNFKGAGDLNVNLSLNYNGSVAHNVYNCLKSQLNQGAQNPIFQNNISIPAWMFNFNGMSVQLLNFEEKFFTHPVDAATNHRTISEDSVKLLASGYHVTDRLKSTSGGDRDIITIMTGDGSTISLENVSSNYGPSNFYTGYYFTSSTKSYIKARVEFVQGPGAEDVTDTYRDRIMYLTKGDGLTYVYREYPMQYRDFTYWTNAHPYLKPQAFRLIEVLDKYGHSIKLIYNNDTYGRPTLRTIYEDYEGGNSISFDYHKENPFTENGIIDVLSSYGNYQILTNSNGVLRPRMQVTKITNPNNQDCQISYGEINTPTYSRKLYNVKNPFNGVYECDYTLNLRRMRTFTNYNKGKRTYAYGDESRILAIDVKPNENIRAHSPYTHGQGRDEFFVNMIKEKTINDRTRDVSISEYLYPYTPYIDNARTSEFIYPVDVRDIYRSIVTTTSLLLNYNNNSDSVKTTERRYIDYPIQNHYSPVAQGAADPIPDIQGETKLVKEIFRSGLNQQEIRKVDYICNTSYNSNFLDTVIVDTVNNIATIKQIKYQQFERDASTFPGLSIYYQNNPIRRRIEIDPYGKRTITNFKLFDSESIFYKKGIFNYNFGPTDSEDDPYNIDTTYYYNFNLADTVSVFDASWNLLSKSLNTYCENNGTVDLTNKRLFKANGYIGSLISARQFNISNLIDFQEEKFLYNNNDTLGKFMYPATVKPSSEGNLKMKINSGGDTTYFFYNLTSLQEAAFISPDPPELRYKVIYQDGRNSAESKKWQDIRLPVKTISGNKTPFPVITYSLYNSAGLVTDYVDANKNLTILRYDSTNRIQAITQPYDFVNLYEYTTYDTAIVRTTDVFTPYALGRVDALDPSVFYYIPYNEIPNPTSQITSAFNINSYFFGGTDNIDTTSAEEGEPGELDVSDYTVKDIAFLKYNIEPLANFISFDSINFKIYPIIRNGTVGTSHVSNANSRLVVTPLDTLWPFESGLGNHLTYTMDYSNATRQILYMPYPPQTGDCDEDFFHFHNYKITTPILNHMDNFHRTDLSIMLDIESKPASLNHNLSLSFTAGCDPFFPGVWRNYYIPTIEFSGTKKVITPRVVTSMDSATVRYKYYNAENKIRILKKLTNASYKISETFFDGFRKPVKSKMFTSPVAYDSSAISYNYLDQKSSVTDGLNHNTKFSYDEYNNLSQTENTDNTSSFTSSAYISSLSTSFYTITSTLINVQEFKDETDRRYIKYTDVVGRLLRETRFVSNERSEEDGPFDPDSSEVAGDSPGDFALHTDYKYDALYRVIEVKTPADKHIYYTYDGFGRQKQRETPDAGMVYYSYDKRNNLVAAQDAKQRSIANYIYTFRTYDGLSRLITLGETQEGGSAPDFDNLDIEDVNDNPPGGSSDLLSVNVYDTLATGSTAIFTNVPSDYHSSPGNNTKGSLVCTAFRTKQGADWNYKFYRYDARARVIRMWTYLEGLGWKVENYYYNSQNQVIANQYQHASGDARTFNNVYDFAGRLSKVGEYYGSTPQVPVEDEDAPGPNPFLTTYTYNQNSQILQQYFKTAMPVTNYTFDNRNRVRTMRSSNSGTTFLEYGLEYNPNGNIRQQYVGGYYKNSFDNTNALYYTYTYDKSNRLVKAHETSISPGNNYYDLVNTYDSDGNILKLKRYGLSSTPQDDFTYVYESGTNKLLGVDNKEDNYTYDLNGNVTYDKTNEVWERKYDFRNLLVSCVSKQPDRDKPGDDPDEIFYTEYIYDEAGNRVNKKVLKYNGFDPQPVPSGVDAPGIWTNHLNEYYMRNVSGAEVALYNGTALEFWNIYGSDNIGRINSDTTKQFYLKDHLGSIRCAVNSKSEIISAQDFDAWGYKMDGRKFSADESKYKFTSKQRDTETDYDYFGARYYDSRIARWGGVEPKQDKYVNYTPYNYALCNPIRMLDIDGKDAVVTITDDPKGNKIVNVSVKIYYTTDYDDPGKFNSTAEQTLLSWVAQAQEEWNTAGNEGIIYNNINMKVNFNIEAVPLDSYQELQEKVNSEPGANFASFDKNEQNPKILEGNNLIVTDKEKFIFPKQTGSHEIGHLMGLSHPYSNKSDNQNSKDVMGWNMHGNAPNSNNIIDLFGAKKINYRKPYQIIKGLKVREDKPKN